MLMKCLMVQTPYIVCYTIGTSCSFPHCLASCNKIMRIDTRDNDSLSWRVLVEQLCSQYVRHNLVINYAARLFSRLDVLLIDITLIKS